MKRTSDCCSTFLPPPSFLAICASIALYYPYSSPIYLNYFISLLPAFFYLPPHRLCLHLIKSLIDITFLYTFFSLSFSLLSLPHYLLFLSYYSLTTFTSSPPLSLSFLPYLFLYLLLPYTQSPSLSSSKPPFPSSFAP